MKLPEKIEPAWCQDWVTVLSPEAKKINELIDYLASKEAPTGYRPNCNPSQTFKIQEVTFSKDPTQITMPIPIYHQSMATARKEGARDFWEKIKPEKWSLAYHSNQLYVHNRLVQDLTAKAEKELNQN